MDIDTRDIRKVLGTFATGVNVVTAMRNDGIPVGVTVNSFTSVSLDPPLVLVCLDKRTGSLEAFTSAKGFAINILKESQQQLSNDFAGSHVDDFHDHKYTLSESGSPVIENVLSWIDCHHEVEYDGGDHIIMVGRIMEMHYEATGNPLLYFRGKYAGLKSD